MSSGPVTMKRRYAVIFSLFYGGNAVGAILLSAWYAYVEGWSAATILTSGMGVVYALGVTRLLWYPVIYSLQVVEDQLVARRLLFGIPVKRSIAEVKNVGPLCGMWSDDRPPQTGKGGFGWAISFTRGSTVHLIDGTIPDLDRVVKTLAIRG